MQIVAGSFLIVSITGVGAALLWPAPEVYVQAPALKITLIDQVTRAHRSGESPVGQSIPAPVPHSFEVSQ